MSERKDFSSWAEVARLFESEGWKAFAESPEEYSLETKCLLATASVAVANEEDRAAGRPQLAAGSFEAVEDNYILYSSGSGTVHIFETFPGYIVGYRYPTENSRASEFFSPALVGREKKAAADLYWSVADLYEGEGDYLSPCRVVYST